MTRASELLDRGRYAEAVDAAVARVRQEWSAPALSELAYAFLGVLDYENALSAASHAVAAAPDEPAYRFLKARVEFMLHRPWEASEDLEQLQVLSERLHDSYYADSAALLAAACKVEEGDSAGAFSLLARIPPAVKVHAGRLLTSASVAQAAHDLDRPREQQAY
jgi:thioredoxin-like negative regulator of GroEL